MGQFGTSMSPLDRRLIALGRCRTASHISTLIATAETLPAEAEFSHYRALAEAFQTLGDPRAIPSLEALLARPGIRGHAVTTLKERLATASDNWNETSFRNAALIELHLAAALHHLDPQNATARDILHAYANDLRGLFAQFARSLI